MSHPAAFQLESLSDQVDAVESVVRVFEGTPKPSAADLAGNRCPLTWTQISAHLHQAIRQPLLAARTQVRQTVNTTMVQTCGRIGQKIVEDALGGHKRTA